MSKISWSEFIIVWLTTCIVIDIVLTYLSKKSGKDVISVAEERKTKIRQLNTPYREDVAYDTHLRRASMTKVEALVLKGDFQKEEASSRCEDDEKVELTEKQKETSDIVKMLFG